MIQKETIFVEGEKVELDPSNLRFNETTLSEYIKTEGGWYDNFGGYLARAERNLQLKESYHDNLFNLKYYTFKDEGGGSDRFAEARAKNDGDVQAAWDEVIHAKYIVSRIKAHLRAWDKNHDNAQSLGHQLRKEMGLMQFSDIRAPEGMNYHDNRNTGLYGKFDEVDNIVTHFDTPEKD